MRKSSLLSNWVVLQRQDSEDSEIHMGMLILISKKSYLTEDKIAIKEMKIWSKYVGEKLLNHMQMINIKIKGHKKYAQQNIFQNLLPTCPLEKITFFSFKILINKQTCSILKGRIQIWILELVEHVWNENLYEK